MKTKFEIRELAPDRWALIHDKTIEIEDMTLDFAQQVLATVKDAEYDAQEIVESAEAVAAHAEREATLANQRADGLQKKLDLVADRESLLQWAAEREAVAEAVEAVAVAISDLRYMRHETSRTMLAPCFREALERAIRGEINTLRDLARQHIRDKHAEGSQ